MRFRQEEMLSEPSNGLQFFICEIMMMNYASYKKYFFRVTWERIWSAEVLLNNRNEGNETSELAGCDLVKMQTNYFH